MDSKQFFAAMHGKVALDTLKKQTQRLNHPTHSHLDTASRPFARLPASFAHSDSHLIYVRQIRSRSWASPAKRKYTTNNYPLGIASVHKLLALDPSYDNMSAHCGYIHPNVSHVGRWEYSSPESWTWQNQTYASDTWGASTPVIYAMTAYTITHTNST